LGLLKLSENSIHHNFVHWYSYTFGISLESTSLPFKVCYRMRPLLAASLRFDLPIYMTKIRLSADFPLVQAATMRAFM